MKGLSSSHDWEIDLRQYHHVWFGVKARRSQQLNPITHFVLWIPKGNMHARCPKSLWILTICMKEKISLIEPLVQLGDWCDAATYKFRWAVESLCTIPLSLLTLICVERNSCGFLAMERVALLQTQSSKLLPATSYLANPNEAYSLSIETLFIAGSVGVSLYEPSPHSIAILKF